MDTKKKWERMRPACGFRRLAEPKRGGFLLSFPEKEERAGERRPFFISFSSLQLSPLVPRGERGKKALSVFMPNTIGVPPRGPNEGALPRSQHRLRRAECRLQRIDVPPSRSAQRNTIRGVG